MSIDEADVIIVGGGPVGMGLAIELAQRDVSTIVVERYAKPQPIPKGQNLTQRTLEHFYFWGVEDEIRAVAPIPLDFGIGGLTAYGTLLGEYHYDWYQRALVRPFYFSDNERVPQYLTEDVLRRRVASLPQATTLYGWTGVDIAQDESGVQVTIAEKDGEGRRLLRGKYVVGCDGSRSLVREKAGITQALSHHDMTMVLLVFRSNELNEHLARYKGKSFFNVMQPELEGYWQFFGRVDTGTTWFFHAPVPAGTTAENFDFHPYLEKIVGAPFDCEFLHIGFWDLRFATADSYQNGRVFIAGDAAHSHPPYGGYGINTGFEDARNLGWKLAAHLEGWAGAGLLASYTQERQPVFASTAKDFIQMFINKDRDFLAAYDPARDRAAFEAAWAERSAGTNAEISTFEPNYEGSPVVFGPAGGTCGAVGDHQFAARAGHHLAPQPLSSGRNVFEALGAGFTLLAFGAEPDGVAAFTGAAAELGVPLDVVVDDREDGRREYRARFVLVRPDQFVAWAGEHPPADVAGVLKRAVGAA